MQTRDISRSPRSLLVVVVAVTLASMLVAVVIGLLVKPGYTSSTQVYVAGSSKGDASNAVKQRVASYAALAESEQLASKVDRQLGADGSPGDLQGRIHADIVPGTLLIRLRVSASSAASAQRTGKAVVQQLRGLAGAIVPGQGADKTLRVVSGPSLPTTRDARHVGNSLLIGFLVGLLLALVAGLALVLRPRRLDAREDFDAAVDLPVLAEVTLEPTDEPDGPVGGDEGFEQLRDNVRFLGVDTHGPVMVLTSTSDDGDGAAAAVQLARSLSRAGSSVLLVDADLRSGTIASRLGLNEETGLSNVLIGDGELADAVQTDPEHGFAVLPHGPLPPNPGELSGSAALRSLLSAARAEYRTVLLSAPALTGADDTAKLAASADGALLVVRRGAVTQRALRVAVRRTSAFGGSVLGVVLAELRNQPSSEASPVPDLPRANPQPSAPATDDAEETTPADSSLAGSQPWSASGPEADQDTGATTEGAEKGREVAADPTDAWTIRAIPDNPEPFWVTRDADETIPSADVRPRSAEASSDGWALDDPGEVPDAGGASGAWPDEWPVLPAGQTDDSATEETTFLTRAEMQAEAEAESAPAPAEDSDDDDGWPRRGAEPAVWPPPVDAARSPWLSSAGESWTLPEPAHSSEPAPQAQSPLPDPLFDDAPIDDAPIDDVDQIGAEPVGVIEWPRSADLEGPVADDPIDPPAYRERAPSTVAEPTRSGPLTAGELASLAGEPDDTAASDAIDEAADASSPAQRAQDPPDGWRPDDAVPDDEPWAISGGVKAPATEGRSEWATSPHDAPADQRASAWTSLPGSSTGETDPVVADEQVRTDEASARDADDDSRPKQAPDPQVGGERTATDDEGDEADEDDRPRTGSLLDDFLTDDEKDEDEGQRREERASIWRPRRWRDG